jgi:hypothetical protein
MLSDNNKKLLALLFMLLLASITCIILSSAAKGCGCNKSASSMMPSEEYSRDKVFSEIGAQFTKLNNDLKQMVDKTIGSDSRSILSKVNNTDPNKLLDCVKNKMKSKGMKYYTFNMNGDKLDSPIINIHETNPELFGILYDCGFLTHMGNVISIAAWAATSSDKSKENLILFLSCKDRINWGDIDTWKSLSTDKNPILTCMK